MKTGDGAASGRPVADPDERSPLAVIEISTGEVGVIVGLKSQGNGSGLLVFTDKGFFVFTGASKN